MDEGREAKKRWRSSIAAVFALTPREDRCGLDAALCEKVREFVLESGAGTLLAFAPLPDEPDLTPFLRRWAADGGGLALPAWQGGDVMALRRVRDLDRDLRPGRGGIPEPVDSLKEIDPAGLDMVLTPGRAFSETCMRLGRGAGCYDALFRRSSALKVGVAYDFQIFPCIPAAAFDVALDLILTPSRIVNAHA